MSASLIKELRERTGAGFLDCKKALEASSNNLEAAISWLQEKGQAKAAKKAGVIAAEGVINIKTQNNKVVIYEVNSQTDFVATNDQFKKVVDKIGEALLSKDFANIDEANAIEVNGESIAKMCINATATIGEKILLRRAEQITLNNQQVVGTYVHSNSRIASIFLAEGTDEQAARNVSMHIASMNPQYLNEANVPSEIVAKLKNEIMNSDTLNGKPDNIKENIAKGMLRKKLSELTLVDQEFVMEKMSVQKYLDDNTLKPNAMFRLEVGEGIEKTEINFADEVAAQMK